MHCCVGGKHRLPVERCRQNPLQQPAVASHPAACSLQLERRQVQRISLPVVSFLVQPHSPLRQSDGLFGLQGSPTAAGAQVLLLRHLPLQHWSSRRHRTPRPRHSAAATCARTPSPASAAPSVAHAPRWSSSRRVPSAPSDRARASNRVPSMGSSQTCSNRSRRVIRAFRESPLPTLRLEAEVSGFPKDALLTRGRHRRPGAIRLRHYAPTASSRRLHLSWVVQLGTGRATREENG